MGNKMNIQRQILDVVLNSADAAKERYIVYRGKTAIHECDGVQEAIRHIMTSKESGCTIVKEVVYIVDNDFIVTTRERQLIQETNK